MYNPAKKKLDVRTVSYRFVGFPDKSKGYRFYASNLSNRIFESNAAKFIEDKEASSNFQAALVLEFEDQGEISEGKSHGETFDSQQPMVEFQIEDFDLQSSTPITNVNTPISIVNAASTSSHASTSQPLQAYVNERRVMPQRVRRSTIPNDYFMYFQEVDMNEGISDDPITYQEAMSSSQSKLWQEAMNDELKSMQTNNV